MIETPTIVQTAAQPAAVIRLTIPRAEIQSAMGPAFGELMATMGAQGIAPAGPFFAHHFRLDPDVFDFEVGVPVSATVAASGRVVAGELPAAKAARTVYHGGYDGIGAAWGEFSDWVAAQGLAPAGNVWEIYAVGPESGPDADTYRTELVQPLRA
mgnify:CR=1 FL=1